ncbi:MAG: hypothetical protein ABEI13_02970 [Candidatus Paceibacteria bacterium]
MSKVIINTLRRSGSTILWRTLRRGTNAICFDEPFNPEIIKLPTNNKKETLDEFIDLLNKSGDMFWKRYSPIHPIYEIKESNKSHVDWLEWLLKQRKDVVIDTTRCWNKQNLISEISASNVFMIHLYRAPASFASSHILPSELKSSFLGRLELLKRRIRFFNLDKGYDYWNMEKIIGKGPKSIFDIKVLNSNISSETFYSWRAHTKLMYFWKIANDKIKRMGRSMFGERFLSVSYEKFCTRTNEVIEEIENNTRYLFE